MDPSAGFRPFNPKLETANHESNSPDPIEINSPVWTVIIRRFTGSIPHHSGIQDQLTVESIQGVGCAGCVGSTGCIHRVDGV